MMRFDGTEVVEFEVYNHGDELDCVELGGDRRERWPRSEVVVYTAPDGPLYLLNAETPEIARASALVNLEKNIAFGALNEQTQETTWTYTTIGLAACCVGMVLILVLCWMTSSKAGEAATLARLAVDNSARVQSQLDEALKLLKAAQGR